MWASGRSSDRLVSTSTVRHFPPRPIVNFDNLSNATVRDYLKKYNIPIPESTIERRALASRHFLSTSPGELCPASGEQPLQRFSNFLRQNKVCENTSRKRKREPVKVKPRSEYKSEEEYNIALAAAAAVGAAKRNSADGYCIEGCKHNNASKSGGVMIACEGDTHDEKWYHLGCVGLKSEPKGEWYCFECTARRTIIANRDKARIAARVAAAAAMSAASTSPRHDGGAPTVTSKATYIGYVKAALKAIGQKKKRSAEGTLKEIAAMVEQKFGPKLNTALENDARRTPVWKSQIHKILRSTRTGFAKTKRNGQWIYRVATGSSSKK